MADDRSVTDEEILSGFKSLEQAIAIGFERQSREMHDLRTGLRAEFRSEFALVRADIASLEHRMLRRFDDVDARFDRLENRVTVLERHAARVDAHLGLGSD